MSRESFENPNSVSVHSDAVHSLALSLDSMTGPLERTAPKELHENSAGRTSDTTSRSSSEGRLGANTDRSPSLGNILPEIEIVGDGHPTGIAAAAELAGVKVG